MIESLDPHNSGVVSGTDLIKMLDMQFSKPENDFTWDFAGFIVNECFEYSIDKILLKNAEYFSKLTRTINDLEKSKDTAEQALY